MFAGITEPEFGEDVTEKIGGVEITYPLWCRVIAKRELPSGKIVEFAAVERWKENYAVRGGKEKSIAPNAMWLRRPYAQLAKCAQAQALRLAFPEVGSAPTADEMEGKEIEIQNIKYEVDIFRTETGERSRWCKIDVEIDSLLDFLDRKGISFDDVEMVVKVTHLPFKPEQCFLHSDGNEQHDQSVKKFWDAFQLKKKESKSEQ